MLADPVPLVALVPLQVRCRRRRRWCSSLFQPPCAAGSGVTAVAAWCRWFCSTPRCRLRCCPAMLAPSLPSPPLPAPISAQEPLVALQPISSPKAVGAAVTAGAWLATLGSWVSGNTVAAVPYRRCRRRHRHRHCPRYRRSRRPGCLRRCRLRRHRCCFRIHLARPGTPRLALTALAAVTALAALPAIATSAAGAAVTGHTAVAARGGTSAAMLNASSPAPGESAVAAVAALAGIAGGCAADTADALAFSAAGLRRRCRC